MFRILIATFLFCAYVDTVRASIVTGYYEGTFLAILCVVGPGGACIDSGIGSISSEDARLYFAYDSSTIPACAPVSYGCSYSYDDDPFAVDDVSWLRVWFDFGKFKGFAIPGTERWQAIRVDNDNSNTWDRFLMNIDASWATTFGETKPADMQGAFWGPTSMWDSTSAVQSLTGPVLGGSGSGRQRIGGDSFMGGPNKWGIEFELSYDDFRIWTVSEPTTLALLGFALAGLAFTRRCKPGAS